MIYFLFYIYFFITYVKSNKNEIGENIEIEIKHGLFRKFINNNYNKKIKGLTTSFSGGRLDDCIEYPLVNAYPIDACTERLRTEIGVIKDSYVLVKRGKCTFINKAYHLSYVGAKGVIIVNSLNNTFYVKDETRPQLNIPVVMINSDDGMKMIEIASKESRENDHFIPKVRIASSKKCRLNRIKDLESLDDSSISSQIVNNNIENESSSSSSGGRQGFKDDYDAVKRNEKTNVLEIPLDHRALLREARRDGRPPIVHQSVQEWTREQDEPEL